ncbi:Ig-like domain-containing protein [Neobacillus drentensis]|uniref:Ig-like domain-containing protein n=1 Tax=Neobacillus drentensis TaxID=220684 RepID=UPI002FFE5910
MVKISKNFKIWLSLLFLIGFILPAASVTPAHAAAANEETEPNDTRNSANELVNGEAKYGAISTSTDEDWYGINTQRAGDIRITLEELPKNYQLYLYDANGNYIADSTNSSTYPESINYTANEPGVYYILVERYEYDSKEFTPSGKYKIKASYPSNAPNFNTVYEPNDTKENAFPVVSGKEYYGTIDSILDVDYYEIQPNGEGQIRATLENLPFNYDLYLYDAQGNYLASSDRDGTASEVIDYYTTTNEVHYIAVIPYSSNYSPSSNYKVKISYPSSDPRGSEFEPNDIKEQSYPILSGTAYFDKISSPTDVDYYTFTTEKEGTIYARLEQLPFNYNLKLLDRNGNEVTYDSSNYGKTDEVIEFFAPEASTYYLKVYPESGESSSTFTYKMKVTYPTNTVLFDKELEPNDTFESAFPVETMRTYSQLLDASNDQDYYKFTVPAGNHVNVSLTKLPFNYNLYVYDSLGNLFDSSTSGDTYDEMITFQSNEKATYYAKVVTYEYDKKYSTINRYNLKISYGLKKKPTINPLSSNKTVISGTADPNVTVVVKLGPSVLGTGKTNAYGAYSIKIPKQKYNAKLTVAAQDDAGNTSSAWTSVLLGAYSPKINTVKSNHTTISGTAGPNMSVTVKRGYTVIGTGKTNSSGNYSVKIPKQKMLTGLVVIIKDSFGDTAYSTTKVQTHILVPRVNTVTSKSTKISGTAGAYLTVQVKYGSKVVASGKTNSQGSYSLKMNKQKKYAKLVVVVKDIVGNYNSKTIYVK